MTDPSGLRLAESAGYNLRVALDSVVVGRKPATTGDGSVWEAWRQYLWAKQNSETDPATSLQLFEDAMSRAADSRDRSSRADAQLIAYLKTKTGVDPLAGDLDPVVDFNRLRNKASAAVHDALAFDKATALYDQTIAWFIRMFTPPDAIVRALAELAHERWSDEEQLKRLRQLASNPHHLRLFFGRLSDPAWLSVLYERKYLTLPDPGRPWPAVALLDSLGHAAPDAVADLLERILADIIRMPKPQRESADFEVVRVASQLGSAGYSVVTKVLNRHRSSGSIRALAVGVVQRADPADQVVHDVADLVLSGTRLALDRDHYYVQVVLTRLTAGANASTVVPRTRMLAAKVGRVARQSQHSIAELDVARLNTDAGDEASAVAIMACHLAHLLGRAREFSTPTAALLEWTRPITGELGQRLVCRAMTGPDDVPLSDKVTHITQRLASSTATGDDYDLVKDILARNPSEQMLAAWTRALGSPSPRPDNPAVIPTDWARAWSWSLVLPEHLLDDWRDVINHVTAIHGPPDTEVFDHRLRPDDPLMETSPYQESTLAALPVLEAAALVSAWRPDEFSDFWMQGTRPLARTLEAVVKADPITWSTDPVAIVTTLREPVYVLHYFQALTASSAAIVQHTAAIMQAADLARTTRWRPTPLGRDSYDFEPDWHNVDIATLALVAAFANRDGDLTNCLDLAWSWALNAIDRGSGIEESESGSGRRSDALHRAINNHRGPALKAVLALAGWEHRNTRAIRADFEQCLNNVASIPGRAGMEYRAVLAQFRPYLESLAPTWTRRNATILFGDDDAGQETFELNLKYSQPTQWFYRHFRGQLFAAARREAENAIPWIQIAVLHEEDGYSIDAVITGFRGDSTALGAAANEIAFLLQREHLTPAQVTIGVGFWRALLTANRQTVPTEALRSSGRWAFVTAVSDEEWSRLTLETLRLTEGAIDLPIEVADRCKATYITGNSATILSLLLDHGEPWEQDYVARTAIETIHLITDSDTVDGGIDQLRIRLVERGYNDA